jgi:hypothetical protein
LVDASVFIEQIQQSKDEKSIITLDRAMQFCILYEHCKSSTPGGQGVFWMGTRRDRRA